MSRGGTTARHENRSKKLEAREGADLGRGWTGDRGGSFPTVISCGAAAGKRWPPFRALAPAAGVGCCLPIGQPSAHAIGAVFLGRLIPTDQAKGCYISSGGTMHAFLGAGRWLTRRFFFKWRREVAAGPIYTP